ncbi:MAG: histidine phosphatase family protein [Pseudomonadota bacterium]
MRRLHIVRHAQVVVDPATPSADWCLAPGARTAIRELANRVFHAPPDRIVSSPQKKAVQTATALAAHFGVPFEIRDGFEEHHRENEPFIENDQAFRTRLKRFFEHPDDLVFGSETARAASTRFARAVDAMMSTGRGDEVVVTHGTVGALFLASYGGQPFDIWCGLLTPDHRMVPWPRPKR